METTPTTTSSTKMVFPAGLRVMVVDDDPLCLKIVEKMLKTCMYTVTTCSKAATAISLLRSSDDFDIVLSDVYMPDMDGFKLLETIGIELDLPVIMMSANSETTTVLRGITHGAVDYLLKPIRLEELRNIWQHVVRRKHSARVANSGGSNREEDESASTDPETIRKSREKKRRPREEEPLQKEDDIFDDADTSGGKKARVVWTVELHQQFVSAVNQLGVDKAAPKRLLDIMGVSGLTRENVASHLQKYRLYLKRLNGVRQAGTADFQNPQPIMPPEMMYGFADNSPTMGNQMQTANPMSNPIGNISNQGNFNQMNQQMQPMAADPSMGGMIQQGGSMGNLTMAQAGMPTGQFVQNTGQVAHQPAPAQFANPLSSGQSNVANTMANMPQPMTQQPMTQQPMTQQPMTQQPMTQQPMTQQPMTQQPMTQGPMTQQPVPQQFNSDFSRISMSAGNLDFASMGSHGQPGQPAAMMGSQPGPNMSVKHEDLLVNVSLGPVMAGGTVPTQQAQTAGTPQQQFQGQHASNNQNHDPDELISFFLGETQQGQSNPENNPMYIRF